MSAGPIAVLDTDVLVLLIGDEKSRQRTETAQARVKIMRERGFTLWVPAPAMAELSSRGATGTAIATALTPRLGGLRVAEFGVAAAQVCGQMVAAALGSAVASGSRYDSTRAAMKFDAMIAAIAHSMGARYLLTANARDIAKYLNAVKSPTQVHRADVPDPAFAYQQPLFADEDGPNLERPRGGGAVIALPPAGRK